MSYPIQSVRANSSFSVISNYAAPLPTLNVEDLNASNLVMDNNLTDNLTTNSIEFINNDVIFSNGHICSFQTTNPTCTVSPGVGLTTASTSSNSTDILGLLQVGGTPTSAATVTLHYVTPKLNANHQVFISAYDADAGDAVKNGIYVTTTTNDFTLHLPVLTTNGFNFHYFVV